MMTASSVTSSYNLQRDWEECCHKARGYRIAPDEEEKKEEGGIVLLNLLDDDLMADDDEPRAADAWMENALRIYDGLGQILEILENKKDTYLQPHQEDEASLLESTILSFVATTANQIESLRQAISSPNRDYAQHCNGVVSFLLAILKEDIAGPFSRLQKKRGRAAMSLWETPLQCRLINRQDRSRSNPLLDIETEDQDQRFMPTTPIPRSMDEFMDTYQGQKASSFTTNDLERPKSIFDHQRLSTSAADDSKKQTRSNKVDQHVVQRLPYQQDLDDKQIDIQCNQDLRKEAALLTASLQNDLDQVQQVEARMTEITALLARFSDLVSEQQVEISHLHDTTVKSQENVRKGQDHLVDAAERTKQSRHIMAKLILGMAMLLLFFNYITP